MCVCACAYMSVPVCLCLEVGGVGREEGKHSTREISLNRN